MNPLRAVVFAAAVGAVTLTAGPAHANWNCLANYGNPCSTTTTRPPHSSTTTAPPTTTQPPATTTVRSQPPTTAAPTPPPAAKPTSPRFTG